jgi:hypothetical protein
LWQVAQSNDEREAEAQQEARSKDGKYLGGG